jgi:hypothetical protein
MQQHANKLAGNLILLLIVWVTGILGLLNFLKAFYSTFGFEQSITNATLTILSSVSLVITLGVGVIVVKQRRE